MVFSNASAPMALFGIMAGSRFICDSVNAIRVEQLCCKKTAPETVVYEALGPALMSAAIFRKYRFLNGLVL